MEPSNFIFNGFPSDPSPSIAIPEVFFTQILPQLDNLRALRLLLYMFWHSENQHQQISQFRWADFTADPAIIQMIGSEQELVRVLALLVEYQVVLKAEVDWMEETYYFLNTPQGQAAVKAIQNGEWMSTDAGRDAIQLAEKMPNIFELYEQNIGVITPIMADILKDAESIYPPEWIQEAIHIAVTRNVRTWNYVQAILKRWQKEGYKDEQNQRNSSQDPESYRKSWLNR